MKKTRSILALVLAALILAALALPAAATEVVDKGAVFLATPLVGSKCKDLNPISGDPDKYVVTVDEVYYFILDENGKTQLDEHGKYLVHKLNPDDTFEADIEYYCYLRFTAKSGYELKNGADMEIRGQHCILGTSGTNLCQISFKAKAAEPEQPQQSVCPWCGGQHEGFFQGIIGWFHNIFASIFGPRY